MADASSTPMTWDAFDAAAFKAAYDREGYAIVRGVFTPDEVRTLHERFDAWRADMLETHASTFVKGNFRVWVGDVSSSDGSVKRVLRGVQWPS
jgi:hypothetical protein